METIISGLYELHGDWWLGVVSVQGHIVVIFKPYIKELLKQPFVIEIGLIIPHIYNVNEKNIFI